MLSIEKCRKILGKDYSHCTDEQISGIRKFIYVLVDIIKTDKENFQKRIDDEENPILSQQDSNSKNTKKQTLKR